MEMERNLDQIKLVFEIDNDSELVMEYTIKDILENSIDECRIMEDLEETVDTACSCFNESQNHCECTPIYENSKVTGIMVVKED